MRELWRDIDDDLFEPRATEDCRPRSCAKAAGRARHATFRSSPRRGRGLGGASCGTSCGRPGGDALVTLGQDEGGTGYAARPAAHGRVARLHRGPHLVEQRRSALGRRRHQGPGEAEPPPGDRPHEPRGHGRLPLAHAGGRGRASWSGSSPTRSPAAARASIEWAWNVNPYHADRQRSHDRLLPARRDREARAAGGSPSSRAFFRDGRALPRRLRARSGRARDPPLAPLPGPAGRRSTPRSSWSACLPTASASCPRRFRASASRPSACGA